MSDIISQKNASVNSSAFRVVFLGTPQFALPTLEKLAQSEFKPVTVFCAPDKPVGRKQILTPPPVKLTAQKYDIPVFQPARTAELSAQIADLKPDLIISAAYGLILPKDILDLPRYGCLNIHPSLLPKYRGASPIQSTILNGDEETGVTIFQMTEKVDAGAIITNSKKQIAASMYTTPELSEILAEMGTNSMLEILPDWLAGKIQPQAQDETKATFTKIIEKDDGLINWQKSALEIERQIRAYQPWPGTHTKMKDTRSNFLSLKILAADTEDINTGKQAGETFLKSNKELAVQTGKGCLTIKKLQPEGGKPMTAQDFLHGHREIIGQIFG